MLGKKGFTLIELLIVIIIVGILAAVAVPMMRGNIQRAQATEAVATLGAVRSQMRLIFAENNTYLAGGVVVGAQVAGNVTGFNVGDTAGKYYNDASYVVTSADAAGFLITATGTVGVAGSQVAGVNTTIDQTGTLGGTS